MAGFNRARIINTGGGGGGDPTNSTGYQGLWDASANHPALPDPASIRGCFYIVSVAGTYLGVDYNVNDWIISSGSDWRKVDNNMGLTEDQINYWNNKSKAIYSANEPSVEDSDMWFEIINN